MRGDRFALGDDEHQLQQHERHAGQHQQARRHQRQSHAWTHGAQLGAVQIPDARDGRQRQCHTRHGPQSLRPGLKLDVPRAARRPIGHLLQSQQPLQNVRHRSPRTQLEPFPTHVNRCRPHQRAKQASTINSPSNPVASVRQISCPRTVKAASAEVPTETHVRLERSPQSLEFFARSIRSSSLSRGSGFTANDLAHAPAETESRHVILYNPARRVSSYGSVRLGFAVAAAVGVARSPIRRRGAHRPEPAASTPFRRAPRSPAA